MATVAEIKTEVLSRPGRYTEITDNLHAKEVIIGDGANGVGGISSVTTRRKLSGNVRTATRSSACSRRNSPAIATGMPPPNGLLNCWPPNANKRYLTTTEAGQLRLDRTTVTEAKRYDGKWVLETNDDTISLEDAALGYKRAFGDRAMLSFTQTEPDPNDADVSLGRTPH
jgi:hypothetical protein